MNDMSQVESFKDKPYVVGWPWVRFYAEVPLRTTNGQYVKLLAAMLTWKEIKSQKHVSRVMNFSALGGSSRNMSLRFRLQPIAMHLC